MNKTGGECYYMARKKIPILERKFTTIPFREIRSNHIEPTLSSVCTYLPFEIVKEIDHEEVKSIEKLPIIIWCNGREMWFTHLDHEDAVLDVSGKRYKIVGFPQNVQTMLSPQAFEKMFGNEAMSSVPIADLKHIRKLTDKPEKIIKDIVAFLKSYIGIYNREGKLIIPMYKLLADWIFYTYVYDAWAKTSYIRIMGGYGTGKSTFSLALQRLCFQGERTESKITESAFYRSLSNLGNTQIMDEIEITQENRVEFRSILKAGIDKDSKVKLSSKHDFNVIEQFNVFSPKVISGTDAQNIDPVLSSRMIDVVMMEAPTKKYENSYELLHTPEVMEKAQDIRDKLYIYRLLYGSAYFDKIRRSRSSDYFEKSGLRNRFFNIYSPLLMIAKDEMGNVFVRDMEKQIDELVEKRRLEGYIVDAIPVIKVLWENTRTQEEVWLTTQQLSNEIIVNELKYMANIPYNQVKLSRRFDDIRVEGLIRSLGLAQRKDDYIEGLNGVKRRFTREEVDRIVEIKGWAFKDDPTADKFTIIREFMVEHPDGVTINELRRELGFDATHILNKLKDGGMVECITGLWYLKYGGV